VNPLPSTRSGDLQVVIVWQPKGSRYELTEFTENLP